MAIFNATAAEGQCFTEDYGSVDLNWSFSPSYLNTLEADSNVSVEIKYIKIIRQYTGTLSPAPFEDRVIILDAGYQNSGIDRNVANGLDGYWTDRNLRLPQSCIPSSTNYGLKYRISMVVDITHNDPDNPSTGVVEGLQDIFANEFGESTGTVGDILIDIPCCACTQAQWNECFNPTNDNSDCPDLCGDICWDKKDSKLSVWMDGYFENPLSGQASFDLRYCLSDKCSWGIGDAEIYITLPVCVNIIDFKPNNILHGEDYHFEEAFAGGLYPGRWKIEIFHPHGGNLDFGAGEGEGEGEG